MFEHWEVGAAALMAVTFLVMGVAVRSGHFHQGVQRTYLTRGYPSYYGNAIFAMIPLGIAFFALVGGVWLQQAHGGLESDAPSSPLGEVLMLLGLVTLAIACWWIARPPAWAKPAWVREYDRAKQAGEPVPEYSPPPMSRRAYALNWLGLAAMTVVWLALSLPLGPLLIGLGLGMGLLVSQRPQRTPVPEPPARPTREHVAPH